jgi:hypothetical protein
VRISLRAGAHPTGKNMAGQNTPQRQDTPMLTPGQAAAGPGGQRQGHGEGGGQVSGVYIGEMHNYGVNSGEDAASALQRTQYSSMAAGGPR